MKCTGTILVVDDSLDSLKMLVEILQAEGCQVRPANCGSVALLAMASWLPDLVLLDIRMPEMDGLEVCRRLKADERTRDIPVIFLSAEADQHERVDGLRLGAVDFITKPFQREELLARIDTHLELWHLRQHLEAQVARRVEDLERKNEALERFTYTFSHDLKTPLVTIKTFLGYLENDLGGKLSKRASEDLRFIHCAADKMVELLNELLQLARIGYQEPPPSDVPLREIVQDAISLLAGQIAQRGVDVALSLEPVWLYGNRSRLVEIFLNLLDNAVNFLGDQANPRIEIGWEQSENGISLFVRDNGMGIPPRHLSKVFGLFEKLDPNTSGTGMGLALVRRIVEAHGGKIFAESDGLGQGSTFRFTLAKTQLRQPTHD